MTLQQLIATGTALIAVNKEEFEQNGGKYVGFQRLDKDGNGGIRKRYLKRVKLNGHLVEMLVHSKDAMEQAIEKFLAEE